MRCLLSIIFPLLFSFIGLSQNQFQQKVSYDIVAELNDQSHELTGSYAMDYTNNSGEVLNEIYIHLWANAFKDKNSFYTKEQLRFGRRSFYFAKENQQGGFEDLDFLIDGETPFVEYVDGYEDIAKIILSKPLNPSESVRLTANFKVKVPHFFSRLGRSKATYHFMHWYPRVAVYDADGWHPMHYGVIGEFFGEYADYNVTLTVPSHLRIGFTGKGIAALPKTAGEKTTWTITAKDVHDFAWVVGKNYTADFEKVTSVDGREISVTILRREGEREHWKNAMKYAIESLAFYERNVGSYAYDQLVIVQGVRKGYGNMEYPGLIVVTDRGTDKSLEYYINHELGHQWFYGALGFNERKEPWLDEGLTTFYEHRYTLGKYGKQHYAEATEKGTKGSRDLNVNHAAVLHQVKTGFSQRADTPLDKMSDLNYAIRSYEQAAAIYLYLEEYVGKSVFDKTMRSFYQAWKFKHPKTEDLQEHFEIKTGKKLDWLFNDLLISNKRLDYKLSDVKDNGNAYMVNIKNQGELTIPIVIDGYKDGKRVVSKWVEPNEQSSQINIDAEKLDQISVDGENLLFDINRENNHSTGILSGLKVSSPLRLNSASERNIFLLPGIGYNSADGLMAGLGWTNSSMPTRRFQLRGFSAYAFGSKAIVGGGEATYDFYPLDSRFRKVQLGISGKSHHFGVLDNQADRDPIYRRYIKFQPFAKFYFKTDPSERKEKVVTLRSVIIDQERFVFNPVGKESNLFMTHLANYKVRNGDALYPSTFELGAEFSAYQNILEESHHYLKLSMTYDQGFYFAKNKKIDARFFAGGFVINSQRESSAFNNSLNRGSLSLFNEGYNDLLFEQPFINRVGQRSSLWALNQITVREGGFKNAVGSQSSINGFSNNYLVAFNLKTDLPFNLPKLMPLKLFGDFGYVSTKSVEMDPLKGQLFYSAGLMLDYKLLQIHLPIFYDSEIESAYNDTRRKFYNRISIAININQFLPWDMLDNKRF